MGTLGMFRGVNCEGLLVNDPADVTAMALLFERIHLPDNLKIVIEFARVARIQARHPESIERWQGDIRPLDEGAHNPLDDLDPAERDTVRLYFALAYEFAVRNWELYGPVFETTFFKDRPFEMEFVEKLANGLNSYRLVPQPGYLSFDDDAFGTLINDGYLPVVTGAVLPVQRPSQARHFAHLLAMQAVRLVLPGMQEAPAGAILEARDRLRNHLPPFWSAMLKLSIEARRRARECKSDPEIRAGVQDIVDTVVLPALLDLKHKIEMERRQWFYRILSPVQKSLRLLIGNPPVTQLQLLSNALVLGADVAANVADDLRAIETLKQSAGLTFLLEADRLFDASAG